jgi:hypothetical protein
MLRLVRLISLVVFNYFPALVKQGLAMLFLVVPTE